MFSRRVRESVSGYVEVDIPYKVGPGLRQSDGQNFHLHEWLDQAEWIGCLCRPVRFIGDLLGSGGSLALVPCSTSDSVDRCFWFYARILLFSLVKGPKASFKTSINPVFS